MFKKSILTSLLVMGMSLPAFANAGKLTVYNHTDHDSTSKINGRCTTSILGPGGITPKGKQKVYEEWQLRLACRHVEENCVADVYVTNNCSGEPITTVTFSISRGILNVTPPKNGYSEYHEPFYIRIDSPAKN